MGSEVVLEVSGREVAWLQSTTYASVKSCELERKRLNGEIEKEGGYDDVVPGSASLELLLQHDPGLTTDIAFINSSVANMSGNLRADLRLAPLTVLTTVE